MKQSKNIFFENILSEEHCSILEKGFFDFIESDEKWINDPTEDRHIRGGYSRATMSPYMMMDILNDKMLDNFFHPLTNKIKDAYNENLTYSHSYIRKYYNGSSLPIHTDSSDITVTLSVNISGFQNWPIHISKFLSDNKIFYDNDYNLDDVNLKIHKNNFESFLTPKGSGVACYGMSPHWRDTLECGENDSVLQIFYHWTKD